MRAIKYKVEVYEGVLAFSHGFSKEIVEIFIPQEKIAFNFDEYFHAHRIEKARGKGKEIKLDDKFAYRVIEFVKIYEKIQEDAKKILKNEK